MMADRKQLKLRYRPGFQILQDLKRNISLDTGISYFSNRVDRTTSCCLKESTSSDVVLRALMDDSPDV